MGPGQYTSFSKLTGGWAAVKEIPRLVFISRKDSPKL